MGSTPRATPRRSSETAHRRHRPPPISVFHFHPGRHVWDEDQENDTEDTIWRWEKRKTYDWDEEIALMRCLLSMRKTGEEESRYEIELTMLDNRQWLVPLIASPPNQSWGRWLMSRSWKLRLQSRLDQLCCWR
jgi:hypothetical protein